MDSYLYIDEGEFGEIDEGFFDENLGEFISASSSYANDYVDEDDYGCEDGCEDD